MVNKLYREVTHQDYGNPKYENNFKNSFHHVPKGIHTHKVWHVTADSVGAGVYHLDGAYLSQYSGAESVPIAGGGGFLFTLIVFLWGQDITNPEIWDLGMFFFIGVPLFFFLFFVVYYFTMPKKENIYNRKHGTITFTGNYWGKNITMPFSNILFHASTGGEDGTGAYLLQIVRPTDRTFSLSSFGDDCYKSISLITWYMDKNRPLPPGTAFDPYRDQDFERRKAEGFPPPLYPSRVKTPEATKAQQKERDTYWKDIDYINNIDF